MHTTKWISYAIGYVFITSGVVKLVNNDFRTIFANLGLPYPELILFLVALAEITCGSLIVAKIYVKQSTTLLIIIMLTALLLTKLPYLSGGAFLQFLFEARLDIVLLILLFLVQKGYRYN